MSAFHPSEVTKEGRLAVMKEVAKKKNLLPFELYYELEFIIKTGTENIKKAVNLTEQQKNNYKVSTDFGYSITGTKSNYSITISPPGYINPVSESYTTKAKKGYRPSDQLYG